MNPKEFKSKLVDIIDIEERNKAFHKLSKPDQRREIAYDQFNLLFSRPSYRGSRSRYWTDRLHLKCRSREAKDLQEILLKESTFNGCSVCARGAVMVSQIRLGNKLSTNRYAVNAISCGIVSDRQSYWEPTKVQSLSTAFTIDMMETMENEYEYSTYETPYKNNTKKKLMNIMLNIIANGVFKTTDRTDYLKEF